MSEPRAAVARPIGWTLHAIGWLLCLAPLLDLAAGIGSLNPGAVPWRFGAAGLLSGALVLPVLGLGLLLVSSSLLEQRILTRVLAVAAFLGVLLLLATLVVFALDAVQVRAQVRQEAKRAFDLATVKASITFVLEVLVLTVLGLNAFRLGRAASERHADRKRDAGPLVVGRDER